jgi:urea transport system permease protein
MQLHHTDPEVRVEAVRSLFSDLDKPTIELIRTARLDEQSRSVQAVMDVALALYRVKHAEDATERLEGVNALQGSLEPEVRNQLTLLVANDPARSVRKAAQKGLDKIAQQAEMYGFINQLFFGLSLGSVLLLAAIGLAITFGVMGVINMAHGEMIMLGAYTTYVVQLLLPEMIEYSLWISVPLAFLVSGLAGVLLERLVIRHLHGRPLETLLATFGISLILQQLVRTVFSPLNRQVATPEWMSGSIEINPLLSLTLNRLYIIAFALLVFMLLLLVLKKTSLGLNVRAVSQNRNMAKAMGIRTDRVDAMTFGLGSGIAGIAGVALSQLTNVGPNLGQAYIIDSFMVVVFGGVGNLWGTLVAAFTLGIANKFLEPVTGAVLASILVLVFIILFIQKRPKGLFPQKGRAAE